MKKFLFTLIFASVLTGVNAQTESKDTLKTTYNKWSVELSAGVNKPQHYFTPGYFSQTPSGFTVDLGVRHMLNNKFGVKADLGYNDFVSKNNSLDYNSQYYRVDLQGVLNLSRVLEFENWTQKIGLLAHSGFGYGFLKYDAPANKKFTDNVGNFIVGLTAQYKLTDKIVLNADFTSLTNFAQDVTFDGNTKPKHDGFRGGVFNGTLGITLYLGKNAKHIDWYSAESEQNEKIENLEKNVGDLQTKLDDLIAKTPADLNKNGIPDNIETYIQNTYGEMAKPMDAAEYNKDIPKYLINNGYVAVYFDFDEKDPTLVSNEAVDFILTYLRKNPSVSLDITGYTDELGKTSYNDKLASARANTVRDILIKANIDASRLNAVTAGEDNSVDKNSAEARRLVRRVTFQTK